MGMDGLIKRVAGSLWNRTGAGNTATPAPTRTRDRGPAVPDGLSLRARFTPPRAEASAAQQPAKEAPHALPDDPISLGLQAMEQRRSAALDKLKQVNAELKQVQQAVPAQSPPPRTLASAFQEERPWGAAEKALVAGSPQGAGGGSPQAESAPRLQMHLRGGRRDSRSGMATAATGWLSSQPATPAAATPQLTRSPRGQRHGDHSGMALAADAWLARPPSTPPGSPGALTAGPLEGPAQAPAGKPLKKVHFAPAEVRTFESGSGAFAPKGRIMDLDSTTGRPMSKAPVREPVPAGPTASAQAEQAAELEAKQAAQATQAAVFATLGRLQALETQDPAQWQQALQDRRLPEEVLDPKNPLDEASVREVFDLHQMFREESPDALKALFGESVQAARHAREEALNPGAAQARAADLLAAALAPMDDEISAEPPAGLAHAASEPGAAPAAGTPPLSDAERRMVAEALRGEGRAMRRMADRAARADLAVSSGPRAGMMRRLGPGAPRPLEGQRRDNFLELLDKDISALAAHAKIDEQAAAGLLLRAVMTGAIGTAMRKDDRLLVTGYLDRQGPPEPALGVPWAKDAMAGWWGSLTDEHRDAITHAFGQAGDTQGYSLLREAPEGRPADMQALHDHLFEHYRFLDDGSVHRVTHADTGIARNYLGLMVQAPEPPTGEPSAEDQHNAALQAKLEKIYAANDLAKKNYRYLRDL